MKPKPRKIEWASDVGENGATGYLENARIFDIYQSVTVKDWTIFTKIGKKNKDEWQQIGIWQRIEERFLSLSLAKQHCQGTLLPEIINLFCKAE